MRENFRLRRSTNTVEEGENRDYFELQDWIELRVTTVLLH